MNADLTAETNYSIVLDDLQLVFTHCGFTVVNIS